MLSCTRTIVAPFDTFGQEGNQEIDMARCSRYKLEQAEAWYHIYAQIAGKMGEYPLENPLCQGKMIDLLKFYGSVYCCDIAAFSIMGNHYHSVMRFDEFKKMSKDELMDRALVLYPNSKEELAVWTQKQWERFNKRIYDISEFMRNVQAAFARWYNRAFTRRGRFWADRFKSTLLEEGQAVLDCMLYVDLNPVRAGVVKRPEEHKGSSIYLRQMKKDRWLVSLQRFVGQSRGMSAIREYRCLLYHRGAVPTKEGHLKIPQSLLEAEEARGFKSGGEYKARLRYIADGMVFGSESFVREHLSRLRDIGHYLRRKNPIKQSVSDHSSVKEQRSHAVQF
jgi:REP element-mobilizing transposase RayT